MHRTTTAPAAIVYARASSLLVCPRMDGASIHAGGGQGRYSCTGGWQRDAGAIYLRQQVAVSPPPITVTVPASACHRQVERALLGARDTNSKQHTCWRGRKSSAQPAASTDVTRSRCFDDRVHQVLRARFELAHLEHAHRSVPDQRFALGDRRAVERTRSLRAHSECTQPVVQSYRVSRRKPTVPPKSAA